MKNPHHPIRHLSSRGLTRTQTQVYLAVLMEAAAHGRVTLEGVARRAGIRYLSQVDQVLFVLQRKGFVVRSPYKGACAIPLYRFLPL